MAALAPRESVAEDAEEEGLEDVVDEDAVVFGVDEEFETGETTLALTEVDAGVDEGVTDDALGVVPTFALEEADAVDESVEIEMEFFGAEGAAFDLVDEAVDEGVDVDAVVFVDVDAAGVAETADADADADAVVVEVFFLAGAAGAGAAPFAPEGAVGADLETVPAVAADFAETGAVAAAAAASGDAVAVETGGVKARAASRSFD